MSQERQVCPLCFHHRATADEKREAIESDGASAAPRLCFHPELRCGEYRPSPEAVGRALLEAWRADSDGSEDEMLSALRESLIRHESP